MTRRALLLLVALVLAAGCSASPEAASGGGASAVASPDGSVPTTIRPTPAPTSAPSTAVPAAGAQPAVPAERNPPGDIPDNVAFVPYANTSGRYSFIHPEGWAETTRGGSVAFTDKLNGVQVMPGSLSAAPTVVSAEQRDVPALRRGQAAFELRVVTAVTEPAGKGVRIVYRRNSAPDSVTGRQYRDEVERYELVSHGREVVLELYGPVGADNVDAYTTMVTSLKIT